MGKTPVITIVGLIWAGMALVGCENCKNCRNRNTAPTYTPTSGAPVVKQDSPATSSVVTPTAGAGKAETTKAVDPVGTKGFETPAGGTPTATGATPASANQTSLSSPNTDARPAGLPGQDSAYRSGEMPVSKAIPAEGGLRMPPPRPVTPVIASVPTATTDPLPKDSTPSAPALPPPPTGSTPAPPVASALPQPPTSPLPTPIGTSNALPTPAGSGNAFPSFDPSSK